MDSDVSVRQCATRRSVDSRARSPTFVMTHHMPHSEAAHGYEIFNDKLDNCEKIVLKA